jgi:transcriptional regulator ATRX
MKIFLPAKHEWVVLVRLSKIQIEMYQQYLDNYARSGPGKRSGLYTDFQQLGKVCTHPKVFRLTEETRLARIYENDEDAFLKWVKNKKIDMTKIEDSEI